MIQFLSEMRQRIVAKGKIYWIIASALGAISIVLSLYVAVTWPDLMSMPKFWMYDILSGPRQGQSLDSTAVVISDDDFANDFSQRLPLKRDVIGHIATNLCAAGARVVALDISMRSDSGTGANSTPDLYAAETAQFRQSIEDALAPPDTSHSWRNPLCRIVLAVALNCDKLPCMRASQAINASDFHSDRVSEGFANLAFGDRRKMPTHTPIVGNIDEPSLSLAAAHAFEASIGLENPTPVIEQYPYITFLAETDFRNQRRILDSGNVLSSGCATSAGRYSKACLDITGIVQGKIVLVGGAWHDVGDTYHDEHDTPVKKMPGVLVHLNFVAAYLDQRLSYAVPHVMGVILELFIVVVLALVTACTEGFIANLTFLVLGGFFLLICEYVLWISFGLYFDALIPLILLFLHSHIHDYIMMKLERE